MKLPAPGQGGEYTPPPAGTFVGVCYRFVDLGTQRVEFQGQIKHQRKIVISWELGDELMDDGRPFTVSKRFSWSMHEKSTLRHDLEAWRGKAFEPQDFGEGGFNTKKLLGQACTLTITHSVKDGKTFANVAGIGKIMRGLQPKPLVNEQIYLALEPEDFDAAVFDKLSDGMKALISASPEYKELTASKNGPSVSGADYAGHDPDDAIPF